MRRNRWPRELVETVAKVKSEGAIPDQYAVSQSRAVAGGIRKQVGSVSSGVWGARVTMKEAKEYVVVGCLSFADGDLVPRGCAFCVGMSVVLVQSLSQQ